MSLDLLSPKDIFTAVSKQVNVLLGSLRQPMQDVQLESARQAAAGELNILLDLLQVDLDALESNAEWQTFTIALYGETNAGKSTIIETLRIVLGEQSKLQQQQAFKELQVKLGITAADLAQMAAAVEQANRLVTDLRQEHDVLQRQGVSKHDILLTRRDSLAHAVTELKRNASLWQKIVNLFAKLPEEKEYARQVSAIASHEMEQAQVLEKQQQRVDAAGREQEHARQAEQRAQDALGQLAATADGAIIGDGRSDYTRATQRYDFVANNQQFCLLDVPGIEGDESAVKDSIGSAVKTAHAVFYVTSKAAPPQRGEGGKKGTLEKIQEHLGAQTEVWTLFNKRLASPGALAKPSLISDDEQVSLDDLDKKMHEYLAPHYVRTLTLSAQPAFMAVASCLVPDSSTAKSQAKFLAGYSQEQLLEKSGVGAFQQLLTGELVRDYRQKIIRSNFNKASQAVKAAGAKVSELLRHSFHPLRTKLSNDAEKAEQQLALAFSGLKSQLDSRCEDVISKFANEVRRSTDSKISEGIDNDEFREVLERSIKRAQEGLTQQFSSLMQDELARFQEETREVIERFRQFAEELFEVYGNVQIKGVDRHFQLKIDIDNGIKVAGLIGAVVGAALMFWNPAAWPILAVGAVTALVSVAKSVMGFFSKDYKMAQQRKAVSENLSKVVRKLREALEESLEPAWPQLEEKMEALAAAVRQPVAQVDGIIKVLSTSEIQLKMLSHNIEKAGSK
ncbi:AAA family ATPase [Janthinobacterium sp. FW305-129]|nr:AAA family ATPase [Janthinobacterium sp. FW305-129]